MITIYILLDNSHVRYIGKTSQTDLKEKLNQHIKEAMAFPEKFGWIVNLLKEGKAPEIKSIFTFSEDQSEYYENLFLKDYKFFAGLKNKNFNVLDTNLIFQPAEE
jgi:hypothetical protein